MLTKKQWGRHSCLPYFSYFPRTTGRQECLPHCLTYRRQTQLRITTLGLCCLAVVCLVSIGAAAEPFRYPEARYEKGELRYIDGIPVLTATGSPEEMGAQIGALALRPSLPLVAHFRDYIKQKGLDAISPVMFAASESLYRRFPDRYRREIEAMVKTSGADRDLVILGNTAFDLEQLLLGCSGLLVSADRSATGGTLYGRNCDFPFRDMIEQYSLVIVYRPTGRKSFAMVTFPGVLASNCGMNRDGLTLGANTASKSADGAPAFNPDGLPYSVAAREVMETCASVDDFDRWIRGHSRTSRGLLLACDQKKQRVYEITTKNIGVREADAGLAYCTNHYRVAPMALPNPKCRRYETLEKSRDIKQLTLADVARLLNAVNQGTHTIQTMIFEPAPLVLHLSIGPGPTSSRPLHKLDLKPLLEEK
jgi:isopenicillin-N N-acyltransferase like protein